MDIVFSKKASVINELWRRVRVIESEWKKQPFNHYLASRVHIVALLAPIGYPFEATEEEIKRYPWIAEEDRGAVMPDNDYTWDGYDEDIDEMKQYILDLVMPDYSKEWSK